MKKLTIIHTADWHLGTSYVRFPDRAEQLRTEQLEMLARMTGLCRDKEIDLLLIAGDLFDTASPPPGLVREVRDLLEQISTTQIVISPGNHDPASPDSPWLQEQWPGHVHIFTTDYTFVELPNLQTRVYGTAFRSGAVRSSLLPDQPEPLDPEWLNILLIHGERVTAGQGSAYHPISSDWLTRSDFDYIALGHIHQPEQPQPLRPAGPRAAYSGAPAARGFDEQEAAGLLCLELTLRPAEQRGGRPFEIEWQVSQLPVASRRFLSAEIDISDCSSQSAIRDQILAVVGETADWRRHAWKVRLTGIRQPEITPSLVWLQHHMKQDLFYLAISDHSEQAIDLEQLLTEHSLAGAFARQIAGSQSDWSSLSEDQQAILRIGLQAFSTEVTFNDPA
ncbi:MAG: DNA repair exonuclease [Eubacteriales bacterium]|nr:DNA repair exonuclease [Eubacteriales bacterium]